MRSPFDSSSELTDNDKKTISKVAKHLYENYKEELLRLAITVYGVEAGLERWSDVASLVSIGYILNMYEESLENPDAN